MGKLIRDGVPDVIRRDGGHVETRRLADDEIGPALREKIVEEAREVAEANGRDETIEELADLLEVVRALAAVEGIPIADIEEAATRKRRARGGFEGRTYSTSFAPPPR